MKLLFLFLLIPVLGLAQPFEGKMTFSSSYHSKSPQLKDEQFNTMMGTVQEYYVKDNNYKSVFNGSFMKMQLYKGAENKSYALTGNSKDLYWEDYSENKDVATEYELEKSKETVMGITCDVLTVYTAKSKARYYYNKKYGVNPDLFTKHQYGNWYYIMAKTRAIPLKIVYENEQFILTSTVVKIEPMTLTDDVFALPMGHNTVKAPW